MHLRTIVSGSKDSCEDYCISDSGTLCNNCQRFDRTRYMKSRNPNLKKHVVTFTLEMEAVHPDEAAILAQFHVVEGGQFNILVTDPDTGIATSYNGASIDVGEMQYKNMFLSPKERR